MYQIWPGRNSVLKHIGISIETFERHNPRPTQLTKNRRKDRLRNTFSYILFASLKHIFFVAWLALGYDSRRVQRFFLHLFQPNRGWKSQTPLGQVLHIRIRLVADG